MVENIIKENITQEEADTQVYEVGFHIVPTVEEDKLLGEVDSIKSLIEKNGGTFISEEFPKNINLAYTISKNIDSKIKKFNNAYFGWVKFEINTDSLLNIKKGMDANKSILRFLIIKTVKESTLIPKDIISPKIEVKKSVKSISAKKLERSKKVVKENLPSQADKKQVSEEELDKTIEELIIE